MFTTKVFPIWLWSGENVRTPVVGSKAMFFTRPVAERVTGSPASDGFEADTVKLRLLPTLTVSVLGAAIIGGVSGSTTVITTD